jgi:hypothetical protein
MKETPTTKYSVAWFKLAEFVGRGEKERALGLYRLLVHSFTDRAYAYQLEGDLLLSFKDQDAQDKYIQAARLYQEDGNMLKAAAVYEHLLFLEPDNITYKRQLVILYEAVGLPERAEKYK